MGNTILQRRNQYKIKSSETAVLQERCGKMQSKPVLHFTVLRS